MDNLKEKICPHCGATFSKEKLDYIANSDEWKCTIVKEVLPEHWYMCYFCDTDLISRDEFDPDTLDPKAESHRKKLEEVAEGLKYASDYRSAFRRGITTLILATLVTIIAIYGFDGVNLFFVGMLIFIICAYLYGIFLVWCGIINYKVMRKEPIAYSNYIRIQGEKQLQKHLEESAKEYEKKQKEFESTHFKCPNCGSYDTHKISLTARTVSASLIGVASPYVGKTFECNECGYKW